jgi:site-specific DNA-methyltransferase (adenine-specific)
MAKITETKIDQLIQDGRNLNKGTEQGKRLITKSLSEFGAGRSVLIDKNNRIIAGNKTHENAKEIGMEDVIVVETDGTKLVAVKRTDVDLDSKQGREMALADNATVKVDLEWDTDAMNDVAEDWGIEVGDWGVGIDDVSDVEKSKEDDFDEDEDDIEPTARRGDIFRLGEHRLMCGDSTDADAVAKLMNGEQADGVLTDPPFGNDLGYGRGQLGERYIANDSDTKVLSSFFAPLDSVLKNNTHCLVWIQWRTFSTLEKAFEKYKLRTVVIWDKMQPGLSGGGFAEQYEMMCVFIKGHATQNEYCGNVWQISREHDKRSESEHPHKKPIALLGKALNLCSHEGDIILDLFGGSGSTMIACEQLGRKCRMMELDPHYCDVIIARWEKLTGQKARKEL